ncbi:hypothetical protein GGF42_007877, partial [Coemansia sp. RSA 2424]
MDMRSASDKSDADDDVSAQLREFDDLVSSGVICISSGSESESDDVVVIDDVVTYPLESSNTTAKRKSDDMDKILRETAVRRSQSTAKLPFPDGVVRLTHMLGEKENLAEA